MAYVIQAVIARTGCFGAALPEPLRVVRLDGGVDMIPLGRQVRAWYGIEGCPLTCDEDDSDPIAPAALLRLCEGLSRNCAVAYVEAEFFGGTGMQASIAFSNGKQVAPAVRAVHAISEALRLLGVEKGRAYDEFEAVGLGQHRDTDDWLGNVY